MALFFDDGSEVYVAPYTPEEMALFYELEECFCEMKKEHARFLNIISSEKDVPSDLIDKATPLKSDIINEMESCLQKMEQLIEYERHYRYKIW